MFLMVAPSIKLKYFTCQFIISHPSKIKHVIYGFWKLLDLYINQIKLCRCKLCSTKLLIILQ